MPPAAKEGKGDCEYPLRTVRFAPGVPVCNKLPTSSRAQARDLRRSPYALLGFSYYPFVTPGTACQGAVTAGGIRSIELSISGGQFYGIAFDMVALLPCLDHAQTALNLCRFLCVRDAHIEARGQRPNFRAHSNLWWARLGWYRIHLVSRRDSLFSRPPYFPAGVNLTAEFSSEPPRGGEQGAGDDCLNRNSPFAESRNY